MGYQAVKRRKALEQGDGKRASPFLATIAPCGFVKENQTRFTLSKPRLLPLAHTA